MRYPPCHYRPLVPAIGQSFATHTQAPVVEIRLKMACPLSRALGFMSDVQQWLPWVMPGLQSVRPLPFGQWLLATTRHLLKLRLRPSHTPGLLAYELVTSALGTWALPMQLAPTPTGCQLTLTLHKPVPMSRAVFETCVRNISSGLGTLQLVLEQD